MGLNIGRERDYIGVVVCHTEILFFTIINVNIMCPESVMFIFQRYKNYFLFRRAIEPSVSPVVVIREIQLEMPCTITVYMSNDPCSVSDARYVLMI